MVLPFFPANLNVRNAGPEETKKPAGNNPPPDSDPFDVSFLSTEIRPNLSSQASPNFYVGLHPTLTSSPCFCDSDFAAFAIERGDVTIPPSTFAEIVSDGFPVLQCRLLLPIVQNRLRCGPTLASTERRPVTALKFQRAVATIRSKKPPRWGRDDSSTQEVLGGSWC